MGVALGLLSACTASEPPVAEDTGPRAPDDASVQDTAPDDSRLDDTAPVDTGPDTDDTGPVDTGPVDTGPVDTGPFATAVIRTPSVVFAVATVSPVPAGARLANGFGPRQLEDEDADFHTGQDYAGERGDRIGAIAAGTVLQVDFEDDEGGSNLVFVQHQLDTPVVFHGATVDTWYSTYHHLDTISVVAGERVAAGGLLGTMGDSGGARSVHLHLEVRLGGWCTLAYQVEHPDSSCVIGYDPAIGPMHTVAGATAGGLEVFVETEDPLVVLVRTPADDLDINRVETDLGILDFDLREGMDPTSAETLDDLDYGWMSIAPVPFVKTSVHHELRLTFPARPAWIEVTDVSGVGWHLPL